jgi:hypothetical protein
MWLFYFEAVGLVADANRYSLWMIPLWIPLALIILWDIKNSSSFRKILPIFVGALILLLINIWLSREEGGVYAENTLYSRVWTENTVIVQFIALTVLLSLLLLRKDLLKVRLIIGKKLSVIKIINFRNIVFCLATIMILLNGTYFSSQFMQTSRLYKSHGFTTINDALNNLVENGTQ